MSDANKRERMDIVIAGHVDHGKSTVIGRLLADTGSLPEGKLQQVQESCKRNSKPFEYAFLLDALKDEQSQGITIDSARVFFKTALRDYIIIDAPGHIEFLKNMVTGASRANAALLVIDAEEGVQENSRRHGYMISMLGIKQIVVVVNKMDLVQYSQDVYNSIVAEYSIFLDKIGMSTEFIPVSGMEGDNIACRSEKMEWFNGCTVLEALDRFTKESAPVDKPLRIPVQDVYKFTKAGDKRRIVAGTVDSGQMQVGDEIIFYPSGKKSTVKTIEDFNKPPVQSVQAGQACAFTLDKQIYVSRGEIATRAADQPHPEVTSKLRVNIFWMGKEPMTMDKQYIIKIGTARQSVQLEEVSRVIDGSTLDSTEQKNYVGHHDIAECVLSTRKAIAFDLAERIATTGRFVIVDDYEIRGGGIIRGAIKDDQLWVRDYVMTRNYKWETSIISRDDRAEKYNQKATLILVTGHKGVGKKAIAKAIEARLFADGKIVYFMGIGNVLYGVDADIKTPGADGHRQEHLRRMAEVANLLLDAGMILIVTAVGLTHDDLAIISAAVDTDSISVIWVGDEPTDITYDLKVKGPEHIPGTVENVKLLLQNKGVIFRP